MSIVIGTVVSGSNPQPTEKFMRDKLAKLCGDCPPLYVKNIADSCIGFMKKYFNEYSKKVQFR